MQNTSAMNASFFELIDLLSMMVFSMLIAFVVIDLLSAQRQTRSPRLSLWVQRLALAALSLSGSVLVPSFAPAFLCSGLVLIVGLGWVIRSDRRNSVLLNIFGRAA